MRVAATHAGCSCICPVRAAGLFVYGYSVYFYLARSDMSGLMQSCFFFGYVACVCLGFFIMLGTVGWRASLLFVRHIYKAIKCE
jgi:transmembrane 9 superfamily protein 1